MKIAFKKIPKLAIVFYLVGFCILSASWFLYWNNEQWFVLETQTLQQAFIFGAIIVAIGSVINCCVQLNLFKKSD
jgi:predicted small integral membrane protein